MQQQQFLEQTANLIEAHAGGRVTGGRVTPLGVRFDLEAGDVGKLVGLRLPGARLERIEQRGRLTHIVVMLDTPRAVTLDGLERQLAEEIPPLTAALGISSTGAPLLIRVDAPTVQSIVAPAAIFETMMESLRRHNPQLRIAPVMRARRIISERERRGYTTPAVVIAGDAVELDASTVRRGVAVGCYTIARGPDGHLDVSVRILHDADNPPWAVAWTAAEVVRFIPAEVTR